MSEDLLKKFDIGDFELRRSGRATKPVKKIISVSCEKFHKFQIIIVFFFKKDDDDESEPEAVVSRRASVVPINDDDDDESSESDAHYGNIFEDDEDEGSDDEGGKVQRNAKDDSSSSEDEEDRKVKRKTLSKKGKAVVKRKAAVPVKKRKVTKIKSRGRNNRMDDSEDEESESESSESEEEDSGAEEVVHKVREQQKHGEDSDEEASASSSDEAESSDEKDVSAHEDFSAPTIDRVIDHEPLLFKRSEEDSVRFLIKWMDKSHIHNTWETQESLCQMVGLKGHRKLKNYFDTARTASNWLFSTATAEDKEEYYISKEKDRDAYQSYKHVERIISQKNDGDGKTLYYVKWQGLPYGDCTWEEVDAISAYQQHIDEFLERERHAIKLQRFSSKRAIWDALEEQPSWITECSGNPDLKLRTYQLAGLNWLMYSWSRNTNVILGDEMGLGKTIQCICFIGSLYHFLKVEGPHLVVVPLSTLSAWKREFAKWTPFLNTVIYRGDARSREICREYEFFIPDSSSPKFNVLITTPELLRLDREYLNDIKFQTLIVDEAHRLKDHESAFYQSIMSFYAENIVLVTGTPIQNHLGELWSLLHILDSKAFNSLEDFIDHFKLLSEFKDDTEEDAQNKAQIRKLHENIIDILKPHLLRRTKRDVEKDLPDKNESILRVGLSRVQRKFYRLICQRNFAELNKSNRASKASLLNILMEMKKCCNHPLLLSYADEIQNDGPDVLRSIIQNSGKMILLDRMLSKLKERGHRVLIFSQMVRMLDILSDYLSLRGWVHQRLDGTMKSEDRQRAMDSFNSPDSRDFCFLLSTRAGGLGINLATADTVIIYDADYNPQNDLQAEARAHRIGQKNIVNIYRFVTKSTVEEKILESAKRKLVLGHVVVEGVNKTKKEREDLAKLIQFGAQNLFSAEDDGQELSEADVISDFDLEEVLNRAPNEKNTEDQDSYHNPEDSGISDFLSAFKVANFTKAAVTEPKIEQDVNEESADAKFWEKLIPAEQRLKAVKDASLYYEPRKAALQVKSYNESKIIASGENVEAEKKKKVKQKSKTSSSLDKGKIIRNLYRLIIAFGSIEKAVKDSALSNIKGYPEKKLIELADRLYADSKSALKKNDSSSESDSFKFEFEGVEVDAKAIVTRVAEIDALAAKIKGFKDPHKSFRISFKVVKPRKWPVDWTITHDSMLLLGVFEYGIGAWDQIFEDERFGFTSMVDASGKRLIASSMLKNRVSYLLSTLRDEASGKQTEISKKSTSVDETTDNDKASVKRKNDSQTDEKSAKKSKPSKSKEFKVEDKIMEKCIQSLQTDKEDRIHISKLAKFCKDKNLSEDQKTLSKYMERVAKVIHHHIGLIAKEESDYEKYELHFWTLVETLISSGLGGEKLYRISNRIASGKDFANLLAK
jgi:chromodomain-helicase-DNA-binding protein 1